MLYKIHCYKQERDDDRRVVSSGHNNPETNQIIEKHYQIKFISHAYIYQITILPMEKFSITIGKAWLMIDMSWLNLFVVELLDTLSRISGFKLTGLEGCLNL